LLLIPQTTFAQTNEIRLVSPAGASIRSIFLPGWGQIYTESRIKGGILFVSAGALLTSGFIARSAYKEVYENDYQPAARKNVNSPEAQEFYNQANQRYKLMKFFFFASIGVWAYGVVDSYVSANIYNAQAKSGELLEDVKKIEELEFQFKVESGKVGISLVRAF